jgi:hypothetical protein
VAHEFLSEAWMLAARDVRARHEDRSVRIPVAVRVNQIITGVPFGPGQVEAYMDTTSGRLDLDLGQLPDPDVTVTTDYATARTILVEQDPQLTMQAFMTGKVKVEGDMLKMMTLQASMPQDETARRVAEEIRAITQ